MGLRAISLPVLKQLTVKNYQMYPGDEGQGFTHTFVPGPNVIVGINGIGKTTLLELIARTLIGPEDLPDKEMLGAGRRELVRSSSSRTFFSQRVADGAVSATAELAISLGGNEICIRRSLLDMHLLYYSFNNTEYNAKDFTNQEYGIEDSYVEDIISCSGIDNYYDFVFLVKYLMFYLEERRTLAWDSWAQIEILRILYIPTALQEEYKKSYGIAISSDSLARNYSAYAFNLEKQKKKLLTTLNRHANIDLTALEIKAEEYKLKFNRLVNAEKEFDVERHRLRKSLEVARHGNAFSTQRLIKARENALKLFFPTLSDYGKLILAQLESQQGCIVCGCRDKNHLQIFTEKLYESISCPICGAAAEQQETHPYASREDIDLSTIEDEQSRFLESINALEFELKKVNSDYEETRDKRIKHEIRYREANQELTQHMSAIDATSNEKISDLDKAIKTIREQEQEAWNAKKIAIKTLEEIATGLTENISVFKDGLIEKFNTIIKSFLAEDCTLHYKTADKRIGQGSQLVKLPEFYINMTSAVFSTVPVQRNSASSVSESQKEFVEISLRMAFIDAAFSPNQASMLIETPEANLDAVFMPKAGSAFKKFTEKAVPNHILIASSNLNGTAMIPSILGKFDDRGEPTEQDNSGIESHVLNLLQIAQKNKALQEYGPEYHRNLEKALYS